MSDMFGLERALTPKERKKLSGKRTDPIPHGHAWKPGTGPAGETCGSCKHLYRKRMGKTYFKCELTRSHWTGGKATDIRARDAACKKWGSV